MQTAATIEKNRTLPAGLDYTRLREEGLSYIESLAHELWTDYNTHDPGITMLEALCFAITELSYRSQFDIKNLLADKRGSLEAQPFFTPATILTNAPLTITDYRKLLIDLKGVNNAWLSVASRPTAEVPLYPDCKEDRLEFEPTHHLPIGHRGLYHVRLDLDHHDQLGDLNSSDVDFTFYQSPIRGAGITCMLPRLSRVARKQLQKFYQKLPQTVQAVRLKEDAFSRVERWKILLSYEDSPTPFAFSYEVFPSLRLPGSQFDANLEAALEQPEIQQQILDLFMQKITLIEKIIQSAWEKLHAHRNLCEDWWSVDSIRNTPLAICADIDIAPAADVEKINAEILIAIETYLNPPVQFFGLKDLLQTGMAVEEIFEGPVLQHGFLRTADVEAARLRQDVYVSDIINLLMDIEGVQAVRNVLLTAYTDGGMPKLPSQPWCVHLDTNHKPVLDVERSKLLFFKQQLPYRPKAGEARDTLLYLRGLRRGRKIPGTETDLPLPQGKYLELFRYRSIQHDLPDTYGIGHAGLPETAGPERRAEARQLKGYLMFFDQILAGFFSQLYHARDLLGTDGTLKQSYFQQYLVDWRQDNEWGIKDIDPLYADAATLQQVLAAPSAGEPSQIGRLRELLVETNSTRHERRNRFLDHLIARFAESFNDYVLTLYSSPSAVDADELIADKIRFIQDYPTLSSYRAAAINLLGPVWDTDQVSGLQRRLARLTGINDVSERNLFCRVSSPILQEGAGDALAFNFYLKNEAGETILAPLAPLPTLEDAERLLNEVYENMLFPEQFTVEAEGSSFRAYLLSSTGIKIARAGLAQVSAQETKDAIKTWIAEFSPRCDEEGMHLLEHFLLRPMFLPTAVPGIPAEEVYKLLTVCLPQDCQFCGEEDPYTFRITLALPYWPERFRDFNFRRFLETTAHREAPAHVQVKVCWLSFTAMQALEDAMLQWRKAIKAYKGNQEPGKDISQQLREASNKLVHIMNNMHSVYPEARLHDCDEGTANPVRLGKTNLGSL